VRLLRFDRHVGLTAAFVAGIRARAARFWRHDSDLQNDPRDLELLLRHLDDADAAIGEDDPSRLVAQARLLARGERGP